MLRDMKIGEWDTLGRARALLVHQLGDVGATEYAAYVVLNEDTGRLKVTWHHNHWVERVIERMPRVRFGQVHVFNNYFASPDNNYCVRAGRGARLRADDRAAWDGAARDGAAAGRLDGERLWTAREEPVPQHGILDHEEQVGGVAPRFGLPMRDAQPVLQERPRGPTILAMGIRIARRKTAGHGAAQWRLLLPAEAVSSPLSHAPARGRAEPSIAFSAILPENPSLTTTSNGSAAASSSAAATLKEQV